MLRSSLWWTAYSVALVVCFVLGFVVGGWPGIVSTSVGLLLVGSLWTRSYAGEMHRVGRAARAIAEGAYRQGRAGENGPSEVSGLGAHLRPFSREVARSLRKLAEERDRMEIVLAAMQDGVLAIDRAGRVRLINRAAARFFSLSREASIGQPFESVSPCPALLDLVRRALSVDEIPTEEITYRGQVFEVWATSLETHARTVLIIRDITEIRALESVRRDFVANVSHELKTPLTSIRAYVETLLDGGIDDSTINLRFLRKIDASAKRLGALISDLLTLSRIESGQAVTQIEPMSLLEVLEEAQQRFAAVAESQQIKIRFECEEPEIDVLGEAEALHQILDNLISNAVAYTEAGGEVLIRAYRRGNRVRVAVEDTGVGIPEADLPRIFERFYRVDKARSREQGGTGLGLSIVKHNVQALNGDVEVTSRLGEGSTFTVDLPAA